ncbi:hypothetical protein NJH54_02440 [Pseudomonas asiatica]|jgi:hypothetical protein|uniref:hypothetical protein n=1 Tax=Pseudomonas TaxID=286 RepID=UPI0003AF1E52|nr:MULTISPECIES: hypothetical protein [Pseudomonas]ERL00721.1 hypothetical protein O999_25150 [Pseudomonas putida LF54]MBA1214782.1 hypothetical protein [Pseudomonas fulva]MBO2889756.1 hypothetical protein [Pseudomonas asiatica]MCK2120167.1 hypothetical protein [Pseudomonas sp. PNPG3]MCO7523369.1 hypothetical protein [Pseudomonas asiatica]
MIMQTRFVVVPAVPVEKEIFPRRTGLPTALGAGYDLYDTHQKTRLTCNFSTRAEADYECSCRNNQQAASGASYAGHG